jgi:integrase
VKAIGHDQAGKVTAEELIAYKEAQVQAVKRGELASSTLQNRVETIRTVFRFAARNHKIETNPAEGLTYTAKTDPRKKRQDFSDEDVWLILTECRKAKNPVIRISNLIAAFHGAALAEIVEANTADFEWEGEHLVFHIRLENRVEGQTLKNDEFRPRRFPLHLAIRDEIGEYLKTLPANSPLFPNVIRDQDGRRAHNAGTTIMRWLRDIGIKDRRKVFHSHRHTWKTRARSFIDEEKRNYLSGHAMANVAAEYGKYPIPMLAIEIEKLPDPLKQVSMAQAA